MYSSYPVTEDKGRVPSSDLNIFSSLRWPSCDLVEVNVVSLFELIGSRSQNVCESQDTSMSRILKGGRQ